MLSKKSTGVFVLCWLLVVASIVLMPVVFKLLKTEDLGVKSVMLLYDFEQVEDLATQDEELKTITTDEAYKYLTVTNTDRALNTYLKFNRKPVKVVIIRSTHTSEGGSVIYSLDSVSISQGRIFSFTYTLKDGKVDDPKEYECIDLKRNENVITSPLEEEVGE